MIVARKMCRQALMACALFFLCVGFAHGVLEAWNAKMQAQQRESQPNGPIHSAVMEAAMPKHLHTSVHFLFRVDEISWLTTESLAGSCIHEKATKHAK